MRKAFTAQLRLDVASVPDVQLDFTCRDEIVPILRALQHIYATPELRDEILRRVAADVNSNTFHNRGREGLDYWHIVVLASVRLGCNLNYDKLQDLSKNHWTLRAIMGLGEWDGTRFTWKRIRDNVCLLKPETIQCAWRWRKSMDWRAGGSTCTCRSRSSARRARSTGSRRRKVRIISSGCRPHTGSCSGRADGL